MNCKNCGSMTNQGENFCRVCGTKIERYQEQKATIFENYDYNLQRKVNNDEELVKAYVGKNYDKINQSTFSVQTFIFGMYYVLYRKMLLLGTLWFIVTIITNMFLSKISSIIILAVEIYFATKFKKIYLKHVSEKVEKIKNENQNKTQTELIEICSKKGGTAIWPVIVFIVIYILSILLIILPVIFTTLKFEVPETPDRLLHQNEKIELLKTTIPGYFEKGNYSTTFYKSYSYLDYGVTPEENCNLYLSSTYASLYSNSARTYLEKNVYFSKSDEVGEIKETVINNNTWTTFTIKDTYKNEYYYVIVKDDRIYKVEFNYVSGEKCKQAYKTIINSLEFKME